MSHPRKPDHARTPEPDGDVIGPAESSPTRYLLFSRGSFLEHSRTAHILRAEATGGLLLIVAAGIALVWANTDWAGGYLSLRETSVGPSDVFGLHLNLSLGAWAADGLLAIFFFVAGLELKREFVAGDLRSPRRAALPVAAAMGGMAVPALVYVAWNLGSGGDLGGWAIPTATDIAFALAVLAVISTHLPSGLRTFLLTLAVVDDLLAITIIALFYTQQLSLGYLALAVLPLMAFAVLVQKRVSSVWLLLPLALVTWVLVHESGVHATVAGVALAFTVPVLNKTPTGAHQSADMSGPGLAEHLEHLVRPISAGIAVPVFAFFAAGVTIGGISGLIESFRDPVAVGIVGGLVVGKVVGIVGSAWLLAKFTHADLDDDLSWLDVTGMAMLAGIGFTVSLLIGDLAYGGGTERDEHVKVAVLTGSLLAATGAALVLRARNRVYRRLAEAEAVDSDGDGVPDAFEPGSAIH